MNMYQMIDVLEKELDDLCNKYPELFPDTSFRKQRWQLGKDLATFQNMTMKDALQRLSDSMVGFRDAMIEFGVSLNG